MQSAPHHCSKPHFSSTLARCAVLLAVCLTSCAGYRLGGRKPAALANIHTLTLPMCTNATVHPRAEAMATSALAKAIAQDGVYRLGTTDQADAILEVQVKSIRYTNLRGTRFDTLYPEELQNQVTLVWSLRDARNPIRTLASGQAEGSSLFSVTPNLQTARNNALPDALSQAAISLVSQLSSGF